MLRPSLLALCCSIVQGYSRYKLIDDYTPDNFLNGFDFFTGPDPTNGFVQYLNGSAAQTLNLTHTTPHTLTLTPDTTHIYPTTTTPGRPSLRLTSLKQYTHGLFLLKLNHIPHGCGTWPAFWSVGPEWASNGEIDIIEGVNRDDRNGFALHTEGGCTVAGSGQTGELLTGDCDWRVNRNSGCAVRSADEGGFGEKFARQGGGTYAMEWTSGWIRMWFFAKGMEPDSIAEGGTPDPRGFGEPSANFQGSCDIDSHFQSHRLVFDTTFCGDYAGSRYEGAGCPMVEGMDSMGSCREFVANNPEAFRKAYWGIEGLRVYQEVGEGPPVVGSSSTSLSSVTPAASTARGVSSSVAGAGMGKMSTAMEESASLVIPDPTEMPLGPGPVATAFQGAQSSDDTPTASAERVPGIPTVTVDVWTTVISCPTPLVCPTSPPTISYGFFPPLPTDPTPPAFGIPGAPTFQLTPNRSAVTTTLNGSAITTAPSTSLGTTLANGTLVNATAASAQSRCKDVYCYPHGGQGHGAD